FSRVTAGTVACALTPLSLAGPRLFWRFDPGAARRRRLLVFTLVLVGFFALMSVGTGPVVAVAASLVLSLLSGFIVLQYSDVRSSYPPETVGRALSLFTMAMFLGVALMQWLTGVVASAAAAAGGPLH